VLEDFNKIYEARRKIFIFKLSAKFVLNAINGLGITGILLLGGWLVLEDKTSVGVLVAALSGMERISQPWRELITFYRDLSAVRVKFHLLLPALQPPPEEALSRKLGWRKLRG
jgi:ABC-type bacteriocin/lantibiotic exporter with double-glycine peptidase domain